MPGPLEGVRVIDLSAVLSGPLAAGILADQGADVVKVETLDGDIVRRMGGKPEGVTAGFLTANRGKRSIAVDIKRPEGLDIVKRLLRDADVLIQNFRPGAVERMGLGEPVVRALNAKIIYVSISGFGDAGPYSGKRVYDPVIQSLSGLADIQRDRETGRPMMIRTVIPDKTTGLTAAQAITAALYARERTGQGEHIKLAMIDAMIGLAWAEGMAAYTVVGNEDKVAPETRPDLIYRTLDGYITAGAVSDAEWQGMCRALEREDWLEDERFRTPAGRVRNATERLRMTAEVLATRASGYWIPRLDAEGVPSAPVLTRRELLTHEQIVANELIVEIEQPGLGKVRQARPPARFATTPAAIGGPAPFRGEHTEQILGELGMAPGEIAALVDGGVVGVGRPDPA